MKNIVLNGITYNNVPAVVMPDDNGNDVRFDINDELSMFGDETALYRTVWTDDIYLDDIPGTTYSAWYEWSASTTDHVFVASEAAGTETLALDDYDYMVEVAWQVAVEYKSGATLKAIPQKQFGRAYYYIQRYPTTIPYYEQGQGNSAGVRTLLTNVNAIVYYNSSGTSGRLAYNNTYGIKCAYTAPTLSATNVANPVLTMNTPNISARCNTTYFATGRKNDIDAERTRIKRKVFLYRTKHFGSLMNKLYDRTLELWDNEL